MQQWFFMGQLLKVMNFWEKMLDPIVTDKSSLTYECFLSMEIMISWLYLRWQLLLALIKIKMYFLRVFRRNFSSNCGLNERRLMWLSFGFSFLQLHCQQWKIYSLSGSFWWRGWLPSFIHVRSPVPSFEIHYIRSSNKQITSLTYSDDFFDPAAELLVNKKPATQRVTK